MAGACVFCKIAAGEIPATVVKRGEGMLAFRDLNPQAPSHLLVIPTHHVATLNETKDAGLVGKLLGFARDVAREVGIAQRGYRVVVNTNVDGGQTVFHLRSEEHTSELQSLAYLVCRLLLEKKKKRIRPQCLAGLTRLLRDARDNSLVR